MINACAAVRGTLDDLDACSAEVVALASLLVLGDSALEIARERSIPLLSLANEPSDLWAPVECPLCAGGEPLIRHPGY